MHDLSIHTEVRGYTSLMLTHAVLCFVYYSGIFLSAWLHFQICREPCSSVTPLQTDCYVTVILHLINTSDAPKLEFLAKTETLKEMIIPIISPIAFMAMTVY